MTFFSQKQYTFLPFLSYFPKKSRKFYYGVNIGGLWVWNYYFLKAIEYDGGYYFFVVVVLKNKLYFFSIFLFLFFSYSYSQECQRL